MTPAALRDRPSRSLRIDGRTVNVRVRESSRARTTRILVGARRPLEIIVPAGTADRVIDGMLDRRRAWIAHKLDEVAAVQAQPASLGLGRPGVVWLAGATFPVIEQHAIRAGAVLRDEALIVQGESPEQRIAAVDRWYRRVARNRIRVVAAEQADRLNLSFRSVAVRDQQTRWGSCSRAGNLSFNWRLVLAPDDMLVYVVIHELCHRVIPNHNKNFWRQVEMALPGWQQSAEWLREHGAELRAYQSAAAVRGRLREQAVSDELPSTR
jgi:predicted metal-dependent hydrolase